MPPNNPYREALRFLWDGQSLGGSGKEQYVCHALEKSNKKGLISDVQLEEAKRVILKGLEGNKTFDNWLTDQGIKHSRFRHIPLQDARRRWLLWLAEHWDNKYKVKP